MNLIIFFTLFTFVFSSILSTCKAGEEEWFFFRCNKCKEGTYNDNRFGKGSCKKCQMCKTCDPTNGKCFTCEAGSELKRNKCNSCKKGYYALEGWNKCKKCHNSCQLCHSTNGNCITCKPCYSFNQKTGYCDKIENCESKWINILIILFVIIVCLTIVLIFIRIFDPELFSTIVNNFNLKFLVEVICDILSFLGCEKVVKYFKKYFKKYWKKLTKNSSESTNKSSESNQNQSNNINNERCKSPHYETNENLIKRNNSNPTNINSDNNVPERISPTSSSKIIISPNCSIDD